MHQSYQIFFNPFPLAWDTERSCNWLAPRPRVPGVQFDRPCRAVVSGASLDGVTEAPPSQGTALSSEPVSCTRVGPVQEEVFLGPVPTLAVTSQ